MPSLTDLKTLFRQTSFSEGMNCQYDPTKSSPNCFPLLLEGRSRRGVIAPTNKHVLLDAPAGNYQCLTAFGSFLLLIIDGVAYYGNINDNPIIFRVVGNWSTMDSSAERIYAELAPATSNLFNRTGTPDNSIRIFNDALAIFEEAIYVFDGLNPPQAVKPDASATALGSFATWTTDIPLYVPVGVLPAFSGAKLYCVSPDFKRVLQSVSGRPSDFMVNLAPDGSKGGDADTVSQTVSFNSITALRGLSTGEVLVGTLYGTSVLELDTTNLQFGEPYLQPRFLFPAGPVNEISIIDILQDTAFITQSGIHSFNAVMQAKRSSNNFPFGARIRSLITNPDTEKAIVQTKTCAGLYDDYVFFGVNTIYGYGAIVFDTTTQNFQSLDLSFGHVKQFANTKISGNERLFFITHDNKIYEAFASSEKHTARMLLGEWTPNEAPAQQVSFMVDSVFTNVKGSGQCKISFYADRVLRDSVILEVVNDEIINTLPIPIPFVEGRQVARAGFHFNNHYKAWKCAVMFEWNFKGELNEISVDGKIETGDNVTLDLPTPSTTQKFAFLADSGYPDELNPGGSFTNGFVLVNVVKGLRYAYNSNGNGLLVNGSARINSGIFTAAGSTVAIQGTGVMTFSLRTAENYIRVIEAIREFAPAVVLHGGDFAQQDGTELDVTMAKLPINFPLEGVAGDVDWTTSSGKFFYNKLDLSRYYSQDFEHISVFFFNGNLTEPDGVDSTSRQAGYVKLWLKNSTKPFNILVCHFPPNFSRSDLNYLLALPKLSAMLCGHINNMQRFDIGGTPLFICGAGGAGLDSTTNTVAAFIDTTHYGYLQILSDALSCKLTFVDTDNNVLNSFSLYS